MTRPTAILVLFALLVLPKEILAQKSNPSSSVPSAKSAKVGKTVYDFQEVDILGKLKRPEGQSIVEPPEFTFRRLLDLDESFVPEIVRAVDEF